DRPRPARARGTSVGRAAGRDIAAASARRPRPSAHLSGRQHRHGPRHRLAGRSDAGARRPRRRDPQSARPDWNPGWKPIAEEPEFRRQVEWELAALEAADIIVMYLAPGSQSPISLLETGLHARGGRLILLCPEGFWRKGNVDITAERYGIEQVATMDELAAAVRRRVANRTQPTTSARE